MAADSNNASDPIRNHFSGDCNGIEMAIQP